MKRVLAFLAVLAFSTAAFAGSNHPKPCVLDQNSVPSAECNANGGNGVDRR